MGPLDFDFEATVSTTSVGLKPGYPEGAAIGKRVELAP